MTDPREYTRIGYHRDRGQRVYDVTAFGGEGIGGDDTAAIEDARTAARVNRGAVFFPRLPGTSGIYGYAGEIAMYPRELFLGPASCFSYEDRDEASATILMLDAVPRALDFHGAGFSEFAHYAGVRDLRIDGGGVADVGAYVGGQITLQDVEIVNCLVGGVELGTLTNQTKMLRLALRANGYGLISRSVSTTIFSLRDSNVRENTDGGLLLRVGLNADIEGTVIESNAGPGVEFDSEIAADANLLSHIHVRGGWLENNDTGKADGVANYQIVFDADHANNSYYPKHVTFEGTRVSGRTNSGARWVNFNKSFRPRFIRCAFEQGDPALTTAQRMTVSADNTEIVFDDCEGIGDLSSLANTIVKTPRGLTSGGGTEVAGQRLSAFEVRIRSNAGTLTHSISAVGHGGVATDGGFVSKITGASSTLQNTPTGADASTAFAAGAKISSAATNTLILDVAAQTVANLIGQAIIVGCTTGDVLLAKCAFVSRNVNGVTRNRLEVSFFLASTGAAFALTTGNIAAGEVIDFSFVGYLA